MRTARRRINENEKLQYREIGKGLIIGRPINGIPAGRRLAKTFKDQFNRVYVQVDGELELLTERHGYLGAD